MDFLKLLIPGITSLIVTLIAVITTAVEGVMMYSIFNPMLKKGLKIIPKPPEDMLVWHYQERLTLMEKINARMVNNIYTTEKCGPVIYDYFGHILKLFNQDIKKIVLFTIFLIHLLLNMRLESTCSKQIFWERLYQPPSARFILNRAQYYQKK